MVVVFHLLRIAFYAERVENKAQAKRQQNFPQVCFDSDCDSAILKCNLYYRNNCFRFEAKCDKNNKPLKKVFFKGLLNLQNKLSKAITTETTTKTNRSRTADEHATYRFHAHVVEEYFAFPPTPTLLQKFKHNKTHTDA